MRKDMRKRNHFRMNDFKINLEVKDCGSMLPTKNQNCLETLSVTKQKFQSRCCSENQLFSGKHLIYFFVFLFPLAIDVVSSAVSNDLHGQTHRVRHSHIRENVNLRSNSFPFGHENVHSRNSSFPNRLENVNLSDRNSRRRRFSVPEHNQNSSVWPAKRAAEIYGDIVIGGLHMIHEREDAIICGPVMPQGGLQALMNQNRIFLFHIPAYLLFYQETGG